MRLVNLNLLGLCEVCVSAREGGRDLKGTVIKREAERKKEL